MDAYTIAQQGAVLIDHAPWGKLLLEDRDRLDLLHRISTNDVNALASGQAAPSVLTSPIGRVIDLLIVLNQGESTLAISSGGRGDAIFNYLRRNVFFNDRVKISNLTGQMQHWGLYGAQASALLARQLPAAATLAPYQHLAADGLRVLRLPPLAGGAFWLMGEPAALEALHAQLQAGGAAIAGLETYRLLRIAAGQPAPARELTEEYIPLELGLWDAVNFHKGCYTGQEIIARMESRGKLAKLLYRLQAQAALPDGSPLLLEGKAVGTLTSLAAYPDGRFLGLGMIKAGTVREESLLSSPEGVQVQVLAPAGAQPERITT